MSVVLGIDPGSRLTGYGVLDISSCSPQVLAWGVLEPPSKTSFDHKLGFLLTKIENLFQNWHPQVMVLEKSFLGKSVHTAFRLGQVRGVFMAVASLKEIQVVEYTPAEVKKKVASSGRAGKKQVAIVLRRWLNLPPETMEVLDATDALSLAYCYFLEKQVSEKMRNVQDSSFLP